MLSLERKEIGRFEEFTLPNGEVVYKEVRGDNHYYWGEIKPSSSAKGGYSATKATGLPGASGIAKFLDPESDPLIDWATRLERDGIAALASAAMAGGGDLTWLGDSGSIYAALEEAKCAGKTCAVSGPRRARKSTARSPTRSRWGGPLPASRPSPTRLAATGRRN